MSHDPLFEEIFPRGVEAYLKLCKGQGWIPQQPSSSDSDIAEYDDRMLLVLANANGPLALYEIHEHGAIRFIDDEELLRRIASEW